METVLIVVPIVLLVLFSLWVLRLTFTTEGSPKAKVVAAAIALAVAIISAVGAIRDKQPENVGSAVVFAALFLGCCVSYTGSRILEKLSPKKPAEPEPKTRS